MRATLSPEENLGVGSVGGAVETMILMPVLTWKLCSQEGRPYPRFPGMYRGVFVQASSMAPVTALQMFFNGIIEGAVTRGARSATDAEAIGCSMAAGAGSSILYGPVDLIAIHQQKMGLGPAATISHLCRTHGVLSLWRGIVPTAIRESIYTSGYLGLGPVFTSKIMQQDGWGDSYFSAAMIGSCIAGVVANVMSQPVDTAKTCIQADIEGKNYRSTIQALPKLFSDQGLRGLYLGGLARTIRTCGAFFIVGTIREKVILRKTADAERRG